MGPSTGTCVPPLGDHCGARVASKVRCHGRRVIGLELDRVTTDAGALATAVASAPGAAVACYDGWTLVDLAGHVGQVHRWVTGVVADRAHERPPGPMVTPPAADELPGWLTAGAAELVAVLDQTPAATSLWTISQRHHDAAFWRTRMVLETALHRWDADEATGRAPAVDAPVARAGIAETLDVYLEQRLAGREVGGVGQRVVLAVLDDAGWTVTLHADHVEVVRGHVEPTVVVTGTALDLWLLLACRRDLTALTVDGDVAAAELLVRGASMVPGPAG